MLEGLQVLQRLAPGHPPGPLLADRAGEPEFEQRVEIVVDRLEHLTENPVDLLGIDDIEGDPPDQIDIADIVQGVRHPVEPAVALEQKAVNALVVLVGPAADERLHPHRVLADAQQGVGDQLSLTRYFDQQPGQSAVGAFVAGEIQAVLGQRLLNDLPHPDGVGPGTGAHARTPRRIVQRRPVRRASRSRAALRWWARP